jgi:biotin-[acetyl-CoA-carboxylase] ligase BirA-like protein
MHRPKIQPSGGTSFVFDHVFEIAFAPMHGNTTMIQTDPVISSLWPGDFAPWRSVPVPHTLGDVALKRSFHPSWIHPFYMARSCTSTMDLARHLIGSGLFPEWASVIAGYQSNGRGQFGRPWISFEGNLLAAIRLPRHIATSAVCPLIPALAVQRVFQDLGLVSQIKWPNDLLIAGKKVGGILIEDRGGSVIAGIGINLVRSPESGAMDPDGAFPAGDLLSSGLSIEPADLWKRVVNSLLDFAETGMENDFLQTQIGRTYEDI